MKRKKREHKRPRKQETVEISGIIRLRNLIGTVFARNKDESRM